jgi:hypothetical protein
MFTDQHGNGAHRGGDDESRGKLAAVMRYQEALYHTEPIVRFAAMVTPRCA